MSKSASRMVSPLSTREARNNLVRRPIRARQDQYDEEEDDEVTFRVTRESLHSPPDVKLGRQFTTSSPLDDAPCGDNVTPGMSVIVGGKGKSVADTSTCSKKGEQHATPKSGSGGRRKNRKKGRRIDEDSITNEDDDEEGSDDDIQPSGKLTIGSRSPRRSPASYRASSRKFALSDDEQEEVEEDGGKGVTNSIVTVLVTLLCLFVAAVYFDVIPSQELLARRNLFSSPKDYFTNHEQANQLVKINTGEWKSQFPTQEKETWTVIGASMKSIFKQEPRQPSVILLLAEQGALPTARCLMGKIVSTVSNLTGHAEPSPLHSGFDIKDRTQLHQQIERDLSSGSTFQLEQLDEVSGDAAMALHAFADNLNAPYKRAALVMTVKVIGDVNGQNPGKEATAENVLSAKWKKELDQDQVSPLLSRLTVSVVEIRSEKDLSSCP